MVINTMEKKVEGGRDCVHACCVTVGAQEGFARRSHASKRAPEKRA